MKRKDTNPNENKPSLKKYHRDSLIEDVIHDPVFQDYGRLLFPLNRRCMSGRTLGNLSLLWYASQNGDKTVEIVNHLHDRAVKGETVFYDIYTPLEKKEEPEKECTGLFFFRGRKNAPAAVLSAGGGFVYVGAMQDSFPAALELSKHGYNAFALIYRPDAERACEDLSRAIAFLYDHERKLGISMNGYSLWGGSAGGRMASWVGTFGTAAFGEKRLPKPAMVVTQYTGLSEVTGDEPATYANVGSSDPIADYRTMQYRIRRMKENGTDAEIEVFKGLSHGFGLGEGTTAEGWVNHAAAFWEKQRSKI